jgi:hypothetical protein
MSDGADVAVSAAAAATTPRRARTLALVSCALGAASILLIVYVPMASSTFPWYRAGLSLAGVVAAVAALRTRPRGRLAVVLALAGLIASLAVPALVAVVFVLYFNFKA